MPCQAPSPPHTHAMGRATSLSLLVRNKLGGDHTGLGFLSASDSDITVCRPQGKDKLCPLHRFHQGTGRVNLDRSFKSNPLCFFQTLLMHLREGRNGGLTSPVKDKWLSPISWPPSGRTPADQAADCIRQHISSSDHVERIAVWLR